jgi:hypothetical protein
MPLLDGGWSEALRQQCFADPYLCGNFLTNRKRTPPGSVVRDDTDEPGTTDAAAISRFNPPARTGYVVAQISAFVDPSCPHTACGAAIRRERQPETARAQTKKTRRHKGARLARSANRPPLLMLF